MTELSTEQAFAALEAVQRHTTDPRIIEPLRLALVRLRELEAQSEPQGLTDKELREMQYLRDFALAVLGRRDQAQQNKGAIDD